MSWSPGQYTKFEAERTRPVRDLLAQLPPRDAAYAADLGCGPGNSTELLRARFPFARIVGMDSSPEMIAAARERLPDIEFQVADIAAWPETGLFDVLLANASLQWVADHQVLLPALIAKLKPGGVLAVQVPDNADEPAHRLMREIAADGPWAETLAPILNRRVGRRSVDWYYALLADRVAELDIWVTIYHHRLAGGVDDLIEWFRGTGLRRYLDPIGQALRPAYLARYREALAHAYPLLPDGAVLLPFPRLFFLATR